MQLWIAAALAIALAQTPATPTSRFTGRVVFTGDAPEAKPLSIDAKTAEGCTKDGAKVDATDPSLVLDSKAGIRNVVVMVEVAGAPPKAPERPVVLDQKGCRFEPHVTVVPVGTTVEFHNSDTVGHNVHVSAIKNDSFNETVAGGAKRVYKVSFAETVQVTCDIHTWMNSQLVVANTNYFAITGADGSFAIEGLPAGEYNVTYWHEKLGKQAGKVKVGADGKVEPVEVKMGLEKKAGPRKR